MAVPWRWDATRVVLCDLANALRLTCPTSVNGKVNTGALTTLEPVEPAADAAWLTIGALARPPPKATMAATAIKRVPTKRTLTSTSPLGHPGLPPAKARAAGVTRL